MNDTDIIEVRFFEQDGVIKGRIAEDAQDREKIVFVRRHSGLWAKRHPLPSEKWSCEVIKDTQPDDPCRGALLVKCIEPRLLIEQTESGGYLFLDKAILDKFNSMPELFGLLEEVVDNLRLPTDGSPFRTRINLGRPIGYSPVVAAPEVGYADTCSFAFRTGFNRPSRVVRVRPEAIVSTVSVIARVSPQPSPTPCYFLQEMFIGWLNQSEPWRVDLEGDLEKSFAYWSKHAFWHDPRCMDEPFEATWKEVIEGRHLKHLEVENNTAKPPLKLVV